VCVCFCVFFLLLDWAYLEEKEKEKANRHILSKLTGHHKKTKGGRDTKKLLVSLAPLWWKWGVFSLVLLFWVVFVLCFLARHHVAVICGGGLTRNL